LYEIRLMPTYITSNNAPPRAQGGTATSSRSIAPTRAGQPAFFQLVPVAVVLPAGSIGVAYSETITAQGGTAPYSYALSTGSLPPGLALSSSGVISGTPTAAGTYSFSVGVTDANLFQGYQNFSITIATASSGGGGNWGWIG
jgi:hypothetical protein